VFDVSERAQAIERRLYSLPSDADLDVLQRVTIGGGPLLQLRPSESLAEFSKLVYIARGLRWRGRSEGCNDATVGTVVYTTEDMRKA
jgi:hypothetical protein